MRHSLVCAPARLTIFGLKPLSCGNLGLAPAAYNAGPRGIQNWLARKGKLPEETQHYVKTITGRPAGGKLEGRWGRHSSSEPKRRSTEAPGVSAVPPNSPP